MTPSPSNPAARRVVPQPQKPRHVYPFAAIVGQEEMKLGLLLNVVAPSIGGVLIMGHRGTGKSTAVRALAELLPPLSQVRGCRYGCDAADADALCVECRQRLTDSGKLPHERAPVPVVDLPLNATEDRVCGAINIERALTEGVKAFEPGLLARAHRGFLYIDEVNLLEDHLVDLLLDVAATGRNLVEREGISIDHPARFVLVGSGNPEEGELRPQLLDRFGLSVEIRTSVDLDERVEIVTRREAFDADPAGFCLAREKEQRHLRRRLVRAQKTFKEVQLPAAIVRHIAELCLRLEVDGHRGELTIARAARALAAFENRREVSAANVRRVAAMALRHRLRRDPLAQSSGGTQVEQAVEELLPAEDDTAGAQPEGKGETRRSRQPKSTPPDGEGDGAGRVRDEPRQASESRPADPHGEDRSAPPQEARLPILNADKSMRVAGPPIQSKTKVNSRGKRQAGGRAAVNQTRGRNSRAVVRRADGATVALDATLRVAATARGFRQRNDTTQLLKVEAADLRYKSFSRRAGTLFIFAVDTSGSMALNRIAQAKGALAHLLRQSYLNRDRIALITFRELDARVLLWPSRSAALAKRLLDALPVGGATPLASALLGALEVTERARRQGATRIELLIFTDGRANVSLDSRTNAAPAALHAASHTASSVINPTDRRERIAVEVEKLGAALQRAGVSATVIDTQNRYTSGGEGERLAHALGGQYAHLPALR